MSAAGPPALEPGLTLGAYRVVRRVGVGGMGSVYEAVHVPDGRRVAVKVLNADVASDPEVRARFLREGEAVARIRHPGIVRGTHTGEADGVTYLVMDLLDGEDLAARIAREGPLPPAESVDLVLAVTAAIHCAHAAGVIHRDLKPANVFLARDAHGVTPRVLDFGVSKLADRVGDSTHTAALLGSPHYMSPEQARSSKRVDARTDQYALGVILYECLTGRRPFHGATLFELVYAITHEDPMPPSERAPAVPPGLDAAVLRAMSRDADDRFASLRDFGEALLPFASRDAKRLWRKDFGAPRAFLGLGALAAALLLLAVWAWPRVPPPAAPAPPRPPRTITAPPPPAPPPPALRVSVDASLRDVAPAPRPRARPRHAPRRDDDDGFRLR